MTAGRFDLDAHARAMRAGGYWLDQSFDDFIVDTASRTPDKPALVAYPTGGSSWSSRWRRTASAQWSIR